MSTMNALKAEVDIKTRHISTVTRMADMYMIRLLNMKSYVKANKINIDENVLDFLLFGEEGFDAEYQAFNNHCEETKYRQRYT